MLLVLNLSLGNAAIDFSEVLHILFGGAAEYESWSFIVEARFSRSIVAIFGGGALAVSGLILQVFFRNPLAGPGVLGISAGASLGVALVILGGLSASVAFGNAGIIVFGSLGALSVLFMLLLISKFVKNQVTLLVIGLMIGYFASAFVSMLFLWSDQEATREFVIWGLGSFAGLDQSQLAIFIGLIATFSLLTVFMIKGMNGMVLGEEYARSLGLNVRRQKILMIFITSILAATVTAFCGPISFIGIAVPQIIRLIVKSKNHFWLLPLCFVGGAFLGILADVIVRYSENTLPLNTVTALIGAPVIIWTIIKMNSRFVRM